MKTTTYTCDTCGTEELKSEAGEWAHVVKGKGDSKIEADVCGWECFETWLTRRRSVAGTPLFAGAAAGGQ